VNHPFILQVLEAKLKVSNVVFLFRLRIQQCNHNLSLNHFWYCVLDLQFLRNQRHLCKQILTWIYSKVRYRIHAGFPGDNRHWKVGSNLACLAGGGGKRVSVQIPWISVHGKFVIRALINGAIYQKGRRLLICYPSGQGGITERTQGIVDQVSGLRLNGVIEEHCLGSLKDQNGVVT
jgi:hypothetical protein